MSEIHELRRALVDLLDIYERPREGWGVEEVLRLKQIREIGAMAALASRLERIRNAICGKMLDNIQANLKTQNRESLPRAKRRRPPKRKARRSGGGE